MSFIRFSPIYQQRVWGGRDLAHRLGRSLPDDKPYGESWEIVDRPEAQSIAISEPYKGLSLQALMDRYPQDIMGPNWPQGRPFPILVKWLDCQECLSLQVHPPKDIALELNGEPKTEAWYIADCTANARLIAGLKADTTRDDFEEALQTNTLETLCHSFPVHPGDHIFIPSGRLHAIDAGNFILEIQQNSDTTYRVYDWGRLGLDQQPRELHIDASLKSIDFSDFEPQPTNGQDTVASCEAFRIRKIILKPGESQTFSKKEEPRILSMISGALTSSQGKALTAGDNVLLPYTSDHSFTATEESVFLVTDRFR